MDIQSTKFNTQSLLNWIQKNPQIAVDLQKNITAQTCPLLEGKLKIMRLGLGTLTQLDELEQNIQIGRVIQYICEHNPLYFLELIQRYDLIREIFKDKTLFAKELQLIDELERYNAQMERKRVATSL